MSQKQGRETEAGWVRAAVEDAVARVVNEAQRAGRSLEATGEMLMRAAGEQASRSEVRWRGTSE